MEEDPLPSTAAGLLLRPVHSHYAQHVKHALRAAGFGYIRPPHANVFPLVPPEGTQASELASLTRMRKQTTAQAVEQLERAGYLERRPDPRHRRARLVLVTPRGEAVRPICVAATRLEEVESLRASLRRLLTKLTTEPHLVGTQVVADKIRIPAGGGHEPLHPVGVRSPACSADCTGPCGPSFLTDRAGDVG